MKCLAVDENGQADRITFMKKGVYRVDRECVYSEFNSVRSAVSFPIVTAAKMGYSVPVPTGSPSALFWNVDCAVKGKP